MRYSTCSKAKSPVWSWKGQRRTGELFRGRSITIRSKAQPVHAFSVYVFCGTFTTSKNTANKGSGACSCYFFGRRYSSSSRKDRRSRCVRLFAGDFCQLVAGDDQCLDRCLDWEDQHFHGSCRYKDGTRRFNIELLCVKQIWPAHIIHQNTIHKNCLYIDRLGAYGSRSGLGSLAPNVTPAVLSRAEEDEATLRHKISVEARSCTHSVFGMCFLFFLLFRVGGQGGSAPQKSFLSASKLPKIEAPGFLILCNRANCQLREARSLESRGKDLVDTLALELDVVESLRMLSNRRSRKRQSLKGMF